MNADFKQSATGESSPQNQLVFVSDFMDTIVSSYGNNIPLLQLLNDAHKAGHRVIVASTSALSSVKSVLDIIPTYGRRNNIPLDNVKQFEIMAKYQLHELTDAAGHPLEFDFVFDDQPVSYVTPKNEIRVTPPFTNGAPFNTSPLTLEQIRQKLIQSPLNIFAPDRNL